MATQTAAQTPERNPFADLFAAPAQPVEDDAMMPPQHAWVHEVAAAYRAFIGGTVHDEIAYLDRLQSSEPLGWTLDDKEPA
jgi:hypothetical protein